MGTVVNMVITAKTRVQIGSAIIASGLRYIMVAAITTPML